MSNRHIKFLVDQTYTPKSLYDSIRKVGDLSAGFCRSWLSNEIADALATSEEAFQLLDHIQNELLRHRDEKAKQPNWANSPFKLALDARVGDLVDPATPSDESFFSSLSPEQGALPAGTTPTALTLEKALNKLKHRSTTKVKFTIAHSGSHTLFIFANAGMGNQNTISKFKIEDFCKACKAAVATISNQTDHFIGPV